MQLNCGTFTLDLSTPKVMGVLNLTPDSFSDGGDFFSLDQAVAQALAMAEDGAAIIDIGGESTRPQAEQITVEEELRRVIPVIEALQNKLSIPISIDTCKPEVMAAAVHAGASMINDVTALASQIAQQTALSLNYRADNNFNRLKTLAFASVMIVSIYFNS